VLVASRISAKHEFSKRTSSNAFAADELVQIWYSPVRGGQKAPPLSPTLPVGSPKPERFSESITLVEARYGDGPPQRKTPPARRTPPVLAAPDAHEMTVVGNRRANR
jgi:hypothetical protein